MEDTTRAIFRRLDAGEKEAFGELITLWEGRVFFIVTGFVSLGRDVEDLCQEVFLRVYKNSDQYDRSQSFQPWLTSVALNVCRDELRRKKRKREHPYSSFTADEQELLRWAFVHNRKISTAPTLERALSRAFVEKLLKGLSPEARLILTLKDCHGWTAGEIAELMGCSENVVGVRTHRARSKLRRVLQKETRRLVAFKEK